MEINSYYGTMDRLRLIKSLISQIENDYAEYVGSKHTVACKNRERAKAWLTEELQIVDHVSSDDIEGILSFSLSTIKRQVFDRRQDLM